MSSQTKLIKDIFSLYNTILENKEMVESKNMYENVNTLRSTLTDLGYTEKNNELTGMLLAIKSPFLWDNNKIIMNEIAYWVEPEHRGSTAGYRLLKEYVDICDELHEDGKIFNYTMSQMHGQSLDYSRFGLKPREYTWSL